MKQIEINPSNEYHILRHFSSVSEDYKNSLISKEYYYHNVGKDKFEKGTIADKDIELALDTKGSKFFEDVPGINNPVDVIKLIQINFTKIPIENQKWKGAPNKKLFWFLIDYPSIVGNKSLIPIDSLSEEERSRIRKVPRNNHGGEKEVLVNIVENVDTKKLKTIEVGLINTNELPFYFLTAFPGDLEDVPDFPNAKNQSQQDFQISSDYWNSHVFVS